MIRFFKSTQPSGYTSVSDKDGGNLDEIRPITVTAGAANTGNNFVEEQPGTITGTVRADTNNDDIGDSPLASVTLTLKDSGGNDVDSDPTTSGIQPTTTTSAIDGSYTFVNVPPGTYQVVETDPSGYQSVTPNTVTPVAVTAGATTSNVNFVDERLSSITGTVRVDTNGDGNADIPRQGAILSLLDANGNPVLDSGGVPITTVTALDGTYSFGDLPPGTYQVAKSPKSGYKSISDKDGGDPDLISSVVVVSGNPNTNNDFLEMLQKCPDLWTDWKTKWDTILGGATGSAENPEGDRYSNLLEYAFCMPPHSGARKPFCLVASQTVAGAVDGVFSRTSGGTKDITYILDYSAALGDPTVWSSLTLNSGNTIVTNNGDGGETVRIVDLESKTGLTAGAGFVRIRVQLDNGVDTAEDATEVLGWVETQLGLCCRTYNNPFLACATFTGTVDSVNGQELVLTTSAGPVNLANLLLPGVAYYIEVETGDLAGHRFDVTGATATSLVIANDSSLSSAAAPFNTLTGAAPALLAGDRIALHVSKTLNSLFPPAAFGAGASQDLADEVQVFAAGAWKIYWLQANGGTPRWVDADDVVLSDKGSTIIPPGQGVFFHNRTAPAPLLAYGEVRGHDFYRPLLTGVSMVGGGYPLDQSATGANSRQLNIADGFFGSRDYKKADSFFLWRADADPSATGYDTYFLLDGSPTQSLVKRWVKVGDQNIIARDAELLLKRDAGAMTRVASDHASYMIPIPWKP